MQLIHPDILAEARGLSIGATGFALLVGVLLWGLGWRWHRFWIVFRVTLTAGLIGLNAGQTIGGQVLAVGILLAATAGLMALEIARVLAFVAGIAAWIGVQTILPGAREMWAVFLCGGLLGLLLYRLWAMMLTSTAGVLLSGYSVLILGDLLFRNDPVAFARNNTPALNATVLVLAFLGVILQHQLAKFDHARAKAEKKEEAIVIKKRRRDDEDDDDADLLPWWRRLSGKAA